MVVALLRDHDGLEVFAPVHDAVADMDNLAPVDARLTLEVVEEVRECTRVIFESLDRLLRTPCLVSSECEREAGWRGGDVRDGRREEELDGVIRGL